MVPDIRLIVDNGGIIRDVSAPDSMRSKDKLGHGSAVRLQSG